MPLNVRASRCRVSVNRCAARTTASGVTDIAIFYILVRRVVFPRISPLLTGSDLLQPGSYAWTSASLDLGCRSPGPVLGRVLYFCLELR